MNPGGVRADLVPAADGGISFGQLFAAQPFANKMVVKSLTGRQLRAVLEQQFASGSNSVAEPLHPLALAQSALRLRSVEAGGAADRPADAWTASR